MIVGQVARSAALAMATWNSALFTGDAATAQQYGALHRRARDRSRAARALGAGWQPELGGDRLSANRETVSPVSGVTWQPSFQLPQRFSAKLHRMAARWSQSASMVQALTSCGQCSSRQVPAPADTIVSVSLRTAATARIREDLHSPIGATGTPMSYTVSRGSLTLTADAVCPVGVVP